ncbi:hypothetical protein RhiirA5_441789 [Rhizophagus irregularis]|uniref:Uncharacterized protein n=1 Tax=Rhizophagus irregularis TaxID=588596 RepID=A0A2N0NFF7_9GLOM|nr:hypothetical protein RhiirA5_441789 [Rhizophagus irregularis]
MLYYDTIIEQFSILHKKRLQELGLKVKITVRSEKILPEVNASSTPQIITPAKANDNDFMGLKKEDFCDSEIIITSISSASQFKPAYDHFYFHNKILDQYPNLYREYSSKNFDYYGITNETSCR